MQSTASSVIRDLKRLGTEKKAAASEWFFKTGKGQYGYGDRFFGVTVPQQRSVAKRYASLPLTEISILLESPFHECRLTALFILVKRYATAGLTDKEAVKTFYLEHTKRINNWDLVDSSAPYILGHYLLNRDRSVLYTLAASTNLWERRIAVLSAGAFIRHGQYADTFKIAEILLGDREDLIRKAVGWMLRVVGDHDRSAEEGFLRKHAGVMPRTMLRYAIEKFPPEKRAVYLAMGSVRRKTP